MQHHHPENGLPHLAPRPVESHKGTFGTTLIIGGSRGMCGAVALAGKAALVGGAGLVRLAVPDAVLDTVAGFEPAYTTVGLPSDRAGRIALAARKKILGLIEAATVVAIGPGLGRSLGLDALVASLQQQVSKTLVVDADALNALAARPDALLHPAGARILTPHPAEFARMVKRRVSGDARMTVAQESARNWKAVVVLKGHRSCIAGSQRAAVNGTGNPGMATGGAGDVLTGLIAALACQGLSPFDAARLAVHVHGMAGDLAVDELGEVSLTATDLVRFLPKALQKVS